MLQILDLISDNPKVKGLEKENQLKQQKIEELFQKLKERNIFNDLFIKKFIKKVNKKQLYFKDCSNKQQISEKTNEQAYQTIRQFDQLNMGMNSITNESKNFDIPLILMKQKDKYNLLHKTNHTNNQETIEERNKIQNFPIANQTRSLNQNEQSEANLNQNITHLKKDKQFSNYLRNVFFKEIAAKAQQKKNASLNKIGQKSRNSHHGRISTDAESNYQKYQLSIKSLIFGNEQIQTNKMEQVDRAKWKKICKFITEKKDKYQTIGRKDENKQLEINLPSKVTLPTINNVQLRNKRCLQHFIRFNHQKQKKETPKQQPNPKLETQSTQIYSGFSFRINTVQIKRHY